MLERYLATSRAVGLSIHPLVTSRYHVKTNVYRMTRSSRSGSPRTLVVW